MVYRDVPPPMFFWSVLVKYLFFLGLGAYLADYLQDMALCIIALALVLSIPGALWFGKNHKKYI
jgi:predicted membrane-bound spermidine synthase